MISTDEDALICDFAETYHILDYRALPVKMQAVLASGLRDDSRIKMKVTGTQHIPLCFVAPQIADQLVLLRHELAGEKTRPEMMTDIMFGKNVKEQVGYNSSSEFEAARRKILENIKNG